MRQKDSASAAEAKLLDVTALMNNEFCQRPGGPRKALHSRAFHSASNRVAGTHPANDGPKTFDTTRTVLPVLHFAKVRHKIAEEAKLVTGIDDDDQKEDMPVDVAGARALISARLAAVQEIAKSERANSIQRSPEFGEDRVENIAKLSHAANREKAPSTTQSGLNVHQFLNSTHSAQTQRRTHVKASILHCLRKNGSLSLRGITSPSNSESGQPLRAARERGSEPDELASGALFTKRDDRTESRKPVTSPKAVDGPYCNEPRKTLGGLRQNWQPGRVVMFAGIPSCKGFSSTERMQLEEKFKVKLKTPRPLPEDTAVESEACHRPKKGSNLVRPVKAQRAVGAKVGHKEYTDLSTIRRRSVSQGGTDEGVVEGRTLETGSHEQPIGLTVLVQQCGKALNSQRLHFGSCQPAIVLGLGGNQVDSGQISRFTSHIGGRHAAADASPRLAVTEGGTSGIQSRDPKNVKASPAEGGLGASATPEMVLRNCGQRLNEFEQREILPYPQIYFLGLESQKIQPFASPGNCNFGYDDESGDYNVVDNDQLAYRYEVLGILGKGSFGQVLKCNDHKHKVLRAVKIIRNKKRFHQQALVEVKILEYLRDKAKEESTSTNIVTIFESFYFRGHLCITFALHDISLYELIKRNNFQGVNLIVIKSFASQLLQTLRFLRKLHVIHCDLKPENILLQHAAVSKIKVIDFGSSCFNHERVYTYIQSRFYRSPEVILGLSYDTKIDIWSFGCILAELFSGYPLFPGENEVEQLACMMEVLGTPSSTILEHASRKKMFFDSNNNPRIVPNSWGKKHVSGTKSLATAIGCNNPMFVNFLEGCLRWDKNTRLTPEELMQHPWMTGVCPSSLPH